jgi:type VI secretion system protein ImpC
VAEAGFCPFIAAAAPQLFGFERWTEFPSPRSLEKIFEATDYLKWKSFRTSESSRYAALTLPRVLARLPYGERFGRAREFNFEEQIEGPDDSRFLWMSVAWVYAARLTDAFARHGWLAATCGVKEGRVEGLPVHTFPTEDGKVAMNCPTEIALANREAELDRLGFLPLLHYRKGSFTVFRRTRSCYRARSLSPAAGDREDATRLAVLLCAARFVHGIQVLIRDRIDVRPDAREYERVLTEWIADYVLAKGEIESTESKARRPLAEARVEVRQVPAGRGSCLIQVWLRPRYQFDSNPPPLMRLAMTIRSRN